MFNDNTLKLAVHNLYSFYPTGSGIDTFYYNLGDVSNTEQIVFYINSDTREGCDTGNEYSTYKVQFNVFSKALDNGAGCDTIMSDLQSIVKKDNLILSGSNSSVISCKKEFSFPSRLVDKVYQSSCEYSIHIRKV